MCMRTDPHTRSYKRLLDAIMCMEVHNQRVYTGLNDNLYRSIDKEATSRVAKVR